MLDGCIGRSSFMYYIFRFFISLILETNNLLEVNVYGIDIRFKGVGVIFRLEVVIKFFFKFRKLS